MSLVLRVDVDKPYGRMTILDKIKSKLSEDYWFPKFRFLGYLKATETFLEYCNDHNVAGIFYHRNCTVPKKRVSELLKAGGHQFGFHAENTRSIETFKKELALFNSKSRDLENAGFTKHGSGEIKIGRFHYPPYEPEKYMDWSEQLNLRYIFGNEICSSKEDFNVENGFYPKMFWIHMEYRHKDLNKLEDIVNLAKDCDVPIIIHPSNFTANKNVNSAFKQLVALAQEHSVPWIRI